MHVMSGVISLKDNATATLRAVRKEQSAFKREVDNTKKSLTKTWDKKYKARLDATAASKKAKQLSKQYAPLRKKIATAVAVKDIATSKIKAVGSRLKSIGKTVTSPVVKLKDKASSALKSLSGKLKSIGKAVAIPIAAGGAAAVAGVGATVKSGMELEQQQVSMEHFVGATNKGMSQDQSRPRPTSTSRPCATTPIRPRLRPARSSKRQPCHCHRQRQYQGGHEPRHSRRGYGGGVRRHQVRQRRHRGPRRRKAR